MGNEVTRLEVNTLKGVVISRKGTLTLDLHPRNVARVRVLREERGVDRREVNLVECWEVLEGVGVAVVLQLSG